MTGAPLREGERVWVTLSGRVRGFSWKHGTRRIEVGIPVLGYAYGEPEVLALPRRAVRRVRV